MSEAFRNMAVIDHEGTAIMTCQTASILAIITSAWFASDLAIAAPGNAPKTREQVRAELAEAHRTGELPAGSYFGGRKLNEVYPNQYPAIARAPTRTRAQVMAELYEARRTGDLVASSYTGGKKLNELYPKQYPPKAKLRGKTREQVRAELAEAQRTGDLPAGSFFGGKKLKEVYPDRYK